MTMEAESDCSPSTPTNIRRRRRRRGGPHVCEHCERNFKRFEHLDRHVRTHTKEKPFICNCGAAFARRDLLTRHQRITSHDSEAVEVAVSQTALEPGLTSADSTGSLSISELNTAHWSQQSRFASAAPAVAKQVAVSETITAQPYIQSLMHPQFLDQENEANSLDQFREFADFLDGVGLTAEWSPYFQDVERYLEPPTEHAEAPIDHIASRPCTRPGTPFSSWLPTAPGGDKAIIARAAEGPRVHGLSHSIFKVTDEQRSHLNQSLEHFRSVLDPDFRLPSRHALTRYVTSYFEGFHSHMVFLHVPTWKLSNSSTELIFSIASLGAQYCFEHRNSERLFHAGKAILIEKLRQQRNRFGPRTGNILNLQKASSSCLTHDNNHSETSDPCREEYVILEPLDVVRSLINLMGFATWECKESLLQEAFTLQSLLVQVLRDLGLEEENEEEERLGGISDPTLLQSVWLAWVNRESTRRAKLIAFSFIHIHSVAYDVYPALRSNEIHLRLPCSTKEWNAPTAEYWLSARKEVSKQQLHFQDALGVLLRNKNCTIALDPVPSPIGNYILLHGLLQRIYIVRDLSLPIMDNSSSLPFEEVEKLERGLRSWTTNWQQAPESSLDPNNENGPIPFTSSSLLGLAYVRIYLNLGPYRQLDSRDPEIIAKALMKCPEVKRSDGVISALLYATHALSIPVRLGVDRVARSQAFFWSVRHSLSALECAVLLSKWLKSVQSTLASVPLSASEDRIVHWVRCIVEEAYAVVDFEDNEDNAPDRTDPEGLGFAILNIWVRLFKSNTQWPFINLIGEALEEYRTQIMQDSHS